MEELIKNLEHEIAVHLVNATRTYSIREELTAKRFAEFLFIVNQYKSQGKISDLYNYVEDIIGKIDNSQEDLFIDYKRILLITEKIIIGKSNIKVENMVEASEVKNVMDIVERIRSTKND